MSVLNTTNKIKDNDDFKVSNDFNSCVMNGKLLFKHMDEIRYLMLDYAIYQASKFGDLVNDKYKESGEFLDNYKELTPHAPDKDNPSGAIEFLIEYHEVNKDGSLHGVRSNPHFLMEYREEIIDEVLKPTLSLMISSKHNTRRRYIINNEWSNIMDIMRDIQNKIYVMDMIDMHENIK